MASCWRRSHCLNTTVSILNSINKYYCPNATHLLPDFSLYRFVKEKLGPSVYSEEQFIFLCHLVAPFLSRYNLDKPSPSILDITVELFNALERMDKHVQTLLYMDPICDLLYPFIHMHIFIYSFCLI